MLCSCSTVQLASKLMNLSLFVALSVVIPITCNKNNISIVFYIIKSLKKKFIFICISKSCKNDINIFLIFFSECLPHIWIKSMIINWSFYSLFIKCTIITTKAFAEIDVQISVVYEIRPEKFCNISCIFFISDK